MNRRWFLGSSLAAIAAAALPVPAIGEAASSVAPYTPPIGTLMQSTEGAQPVMTMFTDTGWVECVGQKLSRTQYPKLWAAIRYWQSGGGDILLPDLKTWELGEGTTNTIRFWNEMVQGVADAEGEFLGNVPAAAEIVEVSRSAAKAADDAGNVDGEVVSLFGRGFR